MLEPQKMTKKQLLFVLAAACCIISFFSLAVIVSAPEISVCGNDHVFIELGEKYIERGAKATDLDGNALPVIVSGTVDSSRPGDVEIVYSATHLGRTVTATRTVTVRAAGEN